MPEIYSQLDAIGKQLPIEQPRGERGWGYEVATSIVPIAARTYRRFLLLLPSFPPSLSLSLFFFLSAFVQNKGTIPLAAAARRGRN